MFSPSCVGLEVCGLGLAKMALLTSPGKGTETRAKSYTEMGETWYALRLHRAVDDRGTACLLSSLNARVNACIQCALMRAFRLDNKHAVPRSSTSPRSLHASPGFCPSACNSPLSSQSRVARSPPAGRVAVVGTLCFLASQFCFPSADARRFTQIYADLVEHAS